MSLLTKVADVIIVGEGLAKDEDLELDLDFDTYYYNHLD